MLIWEYIYKETKYFIVQFWIIGIIVGLLLPQTYYAGFWGNAAFGFNILFSVNTINIKL